MTGPAQYRKKPVVIEAMQIDGTRDSAFAAREWVERLGGHVHEGPVDGTDVPLDERPQHAACVNRIHVMIYTLEGKMLACPGDWIIRGVKGEFYPCKPDIFDATYEPVAS